MAEEIVFEVLWTDKAKRTFQDIVNYLQSKWTEKEVEKLVNRTNDLLNTLKKYPEMCRASEKRKNVRIAILNKQTQLVYHYNPRKKVIVLLLFWNPKQDPKKLIY